MNKIRNKRKKRELGALPVHNPPRISSLAVLVALVKIPSDIRD